MRTIYHEFESLESLLATRLLPGGGDQPIRFVVFGGTGAVGGASVLELCRLILMSERHRDRPWRGEIYATGSTDKEIVNFVRRVYLAFENTTEITKIEPLRHYRLGDRIDLHFSLLHLTLPENLREHVLAARDELGESFEPEKVLDDYFAAQPQPFLRFVEALDAELLHAVVVAIPLPSVATYTLGTIDRLTNELGLDHPTQQRIKTSYLRRFIRGLAVIQQRHARQVVMAHTTAVGGMYRVDAGQAEIRLGFAHSALGKKLVDKKYFADELTQLYIDQGFQVLVVAAAIGIDAVDFNCRLPVDRAVRRVLREKLEATAEPAIDAADLDSDEILLYPALGVDFAAEGEPQPLKFGSGKELMVEAAIRSGENGMFSVANCIALYNVMKVAIPEELATALVRCALFGPERRRGWFEDNVSYYTETENSYFALRLLESYPQLIHSHLGTFAIQSYQALGSSTHQARVHELGLLMMLLRLLDLGEKLGEIPGQELCDALSDLDAFLWAKTRVPCFEDLEKLDVARLAELLGQLCEVDSMEAAGRLMGFDPRQHAIRERGREKFLARVATRISRYLQTITSLGIPIVYRSPAHSADRMLIGPYVAPHDMAVATSDDLHRKWQEMAEKYRVPAEVARDWVIANNGFVDLRPHAIGSAATEPGPHLKDQVRTMATTDEVAEWIAALPVGSYFTTSGLVALDLRLRRLFEQVRGRQIALGTGETWKHLFQQDDEGRHILAPGLIETVRMYSEGLGKVTGTEVLWPQWGY
ncbi:MAG: hypothetical protein GY856_08925 [bacterium]|nr:hypothetical protein [bacterium]